MILIILAAVAGIAAVLVAVLGKEKKTQTVQSWQGVPADVRRWVPLAEKLSKQFDVPQDIIVGIIWTENRGKMHPDGSAGEKGIMQIKEIAVEDLKLNGYEVPENWRIHPVANITTGVMFLDLVKSREPNWTEAIKAYNQGNTGKDRYPVKAQKYLTKVNEKLAALPYV